MHPLLALTSADLKRALALKRQIERHERQIAAIIAKAGAAADCGIRRNRHAVALCGGGQQPSLRDLISGILRQAKAPMSVQDIYEATLVADYRWRSREPMNALNVKLYTDPTFKKVSPGHFALRRR